LPQSSMSIVPSNSPPEKIQACRCGAPAARKRSTIPSDSNSSSERGWTTVARSQCAASSWASIRTQSTPRRRSSAASRSPVGPAPTTSTSVSTGGLYHRAGVPLTAAGQLGADFDRFHGAGRADLEDHPGGEDDEPGNEEQIGAQHQQPDPPQQVRGRAD